MIRLTTISFFLLNFYFANSQEHKIKFAALALPVQSGFSYASIGYEKADASFRKSWSFLVTVQSGALALDAPEHRRLWLTAERIFHFRGHDKKLRPWYSVFVEAGKRRIGSGYNRDYEDIVTLYKKGFEVSPGAAIGCSLLLGKHLGIEVLAGPKIIFRNGKEYYERYPTTEVSKRNFNEVKTGSRVGFCFYYQF